MSKQLAVVTPSYAPDVDLFAELHHSVLTHTAPETVHHVIVPPGHRTVFAQFEGRRCRVWTEDELLPRRFRRLVWPRWWINLRRPFPPVRGWVLQQALKIALAGELDVDAVLIADSDVAFVQSIDPRRFIRDDGRMPLYRLEGAVHTGMERHVIWHRVAHELFGLEHPAAPPLHDYVSSMNVWSPAVVRAMQQRIGDISGRPWIDAVTGKLHVSEFVLYGVFVDHLVAGGGPHPVSDTTFCHDYWDRTPMDESVAADFVARMPADAVAIMISAKSGTPHEVRSAVIRRCAEAAVATSPPALS